MNTATAYARRARAARDAARATAATFRVEDDAAMARLDALTHYARRCEQLAYRAAGTDSRPMRAAGDYADEAYTVAYYAGLLRGLRQRVQAGETDLEYAVQSVQHHLRTA